MSMLPHACLHECMHANIKQANEQGANEQEQRNTKLTNMSRATQHVLPQVPAHMAAMHEEIASMLLLLDAKEGKDLEKLVKRHKASIEGRCCSSSFVVCACVVLHGVCARVHVSCWCVSRM